jgi:hypothetical protein
MRLTTKLISVLLLVLIISYLSTLPGCGDSASSGGCPNSTAPSGSTITGPASLGAPFIYTSTCYPTVGFTVTDASGAPMNDICVEIYSDANIALHTGLPDCGNVAANPQNAMVTRTDSRGNVMIELLTGPTPTGKTHFVQVSSGAINATATTAPAAQ